MVYDDQTETQRLSKADIEARLAAQRRHEVRTMLSTPIRGASATNFTPQSLPKPEPRVLLDAQLDDLPLHPAPKLPVLQAYSTTPAAEDTPRTNLALTLGALGVASVLILLGTCALFLL
ncbi:MAG: hypothetical protein AAGI01_05245 [Myxococcota bacterium]